MDRNSNKQTFLCTSTKVVARVPFVHKPKYDFFQNPFCSSQLRSFDILHMALVWNSDLGTVCDNWHNV